MNPRCLFVVSVILAAVPAAFAQAPDFAPPAAKPPDRATLQAIEAKTAELAKALADLKAQGIPDDIRAEVEIYHKAATWIVRHGEWYQPDFARWTLETLDTGLERARQAPQAPWRSITGRAVVRAYRSRVDDSVQPYAVVLPAAYGQNPGEKWRLDVILHGRDTSLTEVKFLRTHQGAKPAPDRPFVQLFIFGRGNNAYRWAGETDVFEALEHFRESERKLGRGALLDPARTVLRGFSMGGAGTWHLGLHHPDRWCVLGPGAGFTTTRGYVKNLPASLPPYQEACLHIYDAVDYAENVFNVPVVAYSGDQDPQMAAARNIEERLRGTGITMTHLIAPGLGHTFPPEWQDKAEAEYSKFAGPGRGRPAWPNRIRFVTYTPKYGRCDWLQVVALERLYEKAVVDARLTDQGPDVTTRNVRLLSLRLLAGRAARVTVDGQAVANVGTQGADRVSQVHLRKVAGKWTLLNGTTDPGEAGLAKVAGLQGPIDDAFTERFVCVRGTGRPWHPATDRYARANLERFRQEWSQYLRGDLLVKDDHAVTEADIRGAHLVLFGDPASNSLIARVIDKLPLTWTSTAIEFAGRKVSAENHVPVLIYPSPLSAGRYVVLNSGHTFHAADFRGTNALLYPRLGDYALLRLGPANADPLATEVVAAGLFDEQWRLR
ncbi:MAG: hypothetical protein NZ700_17690 [Gemmataceae bacterium]|nr:hypothetical protein [Gemmataceae bacterium]MDW8267419.1 hypothetical protein [Gemmataceae bacterium]